MARYHKIRRFPKFIQAFSILSETRFHVKKIRYIFDLSFYHVSGIQSVSSITYLVYIRDDIFVSHRENRDYEQLRGEAKSPDTPYF